MTIPAVPLLMIILTVVILVVFLQLKRYHRQHPNAEMLLDVMQEHLSDDAPTSSR